MAKEDVYVPQVDFDNNMGQQPVENGIFSDVIHDTVQAPDWPRFIYLFHRLFEAHFLPIHMAILVVGSGLYLYVVGDKPDTLGLGWTFAISAYLRVLGFLAVGLYMGFYESYHHICVTSREAEMTAAGLAEGMAGGFSYRSIRKNWMDYIAIPIVAPMYGSIPATQAQICHFWTQDLVYTVSAKPLRKRAKSVLADILDV
jgi:hypothetical protein